MNLMFMRTLKKMRSYFLTFIFICAIISESRAQYSLEKGDDYTIKIEDSFILSGFLKGVMDNEENVFYCDLTRILKFNSDGIFQKEIVPTGKGPGEFQTLIDCNVTENYLVVLPFN